MSCFVDSFQSPNAHSPLAHNLNPEPNTIDVHRLQVREAIRAAEKAIRDTLLNGGTTLRIIVGQGNHSLDGYPSLKPALLRICGEYVSAFCSVNIR